MISYQYDLFEQEKTELDMCHEKVDTVLVQVNNLRRGLFQRHTEMGKLIIRQQQEIDQLRNMIMEIRNI